VRRVDLVDRPVPSSPWHLLHLSPRLHLEHPFDQWRLYNLSAQLLLCCQSHLVDQAVPMVL